MANACNPFAPRAIGRLAPVGDVVVSSCKGIVPVDGCSGDLYGVLGVERSCSYDQVRKAARRHLAASHPDSGGSEAAFLEASAVWNAFATPQARAAYDAGLAEARAGPGTIRVPRREQKRLSPAWWKPAWDIVPGEEGLRWFEMCRDALWGLRACVQVLSGVSEKGPPFWMERGVMMASLEHGLSPAFARCLALAATDQEKKFCLEEE